MKAMRRPVVLAAMILAASCSRASGCSGASSTGPARASSTTPPLATTYQPSRPPPGEPSTPMDAPKPLHDGEPVVAADLTRIDPVELLPQARKIALGNDKHAVLTRIFATKGVAAGTVDVAGDGGVTYEFEWLYFDKGRPPGSDKVENGLWISARRGRFSVMELHHASALSRPKERRPDPAPDPRCSGRDAWKAAVRSGVPAIAVASMRYEPAAFPPGPGPFAWKFRVDGHEELGREVDGTSCAIVGRSVRRR